MPKKKKSPAPAGCDEVQLTVEMDGELKARLTALAKDEGLSRSALVRDVMSAALMAAPLAHKNGLRVAEWTKFEIRMAALPNRLVEQIPEGD